MFNWFVTGPTDWTTSNGSWGLTNHVENLTSPKILGTQQVVNAPRQNMTYGIAAPAAFDARAVAGATQPYVNTYLRNPGKGKTFDYFLRVPKAGNYQLTFNAGTTGSNEQLRVAVNGTETRTVTLTVTPSVNTFADTLVGTFRLEEGMNLLHITSVNETTWNMQTVTVAPAPAPNGVPTVASPAGASPTTISGKTTSVSVLGADNGGEAGLRYSWEAVDDQPNSVTFSVNGSNQAKNSVATFSRPGSYTLRVTISDGVSSTTSSVVVNVVQTITTVTVAPTGEAIANGETKQLVATAKDQFGIQLFAQPAFSWQVDNSLGTVSQTGLYQSPTTGLGSATVRATTNGVSGTATVITQSPRPADNPANALPGIEYGYYEGTYSNVPNFDTLTPIATGLLDNITVAVRQRNDNFAIQYTGYILTPTAGTYTFYTTSDDGSKLHVGGQLVVNNDGKHAVQERSGQIILDAGWHAFKLGFFDATGGETLSWAFSGPGIAKQAIPNANLERVDRAPTVATPPAAQPNPITGNSTNLSVFGADESGESILTYTWSATSVPSGAATPTFSANGTNASKNSTATFYKAGTYQLQVAISDGTLTTNATISVIVDQTLTTLQISPINPIVKQLHTQQFAAVGYDQFGNVLTSPPPFIWATSPNGGTINSSGLYTAPSVVGTHTVTVSVNGVSASTNVNVTADASPYIVNPPTASPNPVTGTQTTLNVLGGDDTGGEPGLTYTWSALFVPPGASPPTFSINGTNESKQTVATFTHPGTYTLAVQLSDGYQSTTVTLEVGVGAASSGPIVATAASASNNPVTGNSTQLSVLGADDGGEANLTYTWSLTGSPPAAVSFSANATNAAKNTSATFIKPGTYDFAVTISDGAQSTSSNVSVTVNQTVTSIAVSPASTSVPNNGTKQFIATAYDQFGAGLTSQPSFTWSVSSTGSPGTITSTGFYTAPSSGSPVDTVRASVDDISGAATVTVSAPTSSDIFTNHEDIGSPSLPGDASFDAVNSVYTIQASGADIWGTADQFHYVYKSFSGDGEIVARVAGVQNTHSRAKAGVMFRESLSANSRMASVLLAPDKQISLQQRGSTGGGVSTQNVTTSGAPYWVRLVKSAGTFTGYRSPDGATWTQIGSPVAVTMGSSVYVGLALTSHNNLQLNTSTFDNVSVTQLAAVGGSPLKRGKIPNASAAARASDSSAWADLQSEAGNSDVYVVTMKPKS